MSVIGIGGPGIPLPYPALNYGYSPVGGTNRIDLYPGSTILIPSGTWFINPGIYTFIQVLDPVTNSWAVIPDSSLGIPQFVNSDGSNYRLANLTGCMVGAIVTSAGTGYTSSNPPIITASAGDSTWRAIVGGWVQTYTISSGGANYSRPPVVLVSAPPAGGVQATAVAILTAGVVTSIAATNYGAGYTSAPTVTIIPSETEVNNVTPAVATANITNTDGVTGVICTNPGNSVGVLPTLSFSSGAAAATAVGCFAVTGFSFSTSGVAYGTSVTHQLQVTKGAAAASGNPAVGERIFTPRLCRATVTSSAGGALNTAQWTASGVIVDGGLFQNTSGNSMVVSSLVPSASLPTTAAVSVPTYGGVLDTSFITPVL